MRVNHSGQIYARNIMIEWQKYCIWYILCGISPPRFVVFFSFLDSTLSGHVTQKSDFLRNKKIRFTDFSEAAKFWNGLVNFHKVMIIIRFYANYSFRLACLCTYGLFSFSYFSRTIANWSASEAILSSTSLESFKSNLSAFLK